jgi:hypothetical protein
MPSGIEPLQLSKTVHDSKNALLHELIDLCSKYNRLLPVALQMRGGGQSGAPDGRLADYLDKISMCATAYLLHKPPVLRKERGLGKWQEVAKLINEVGQHARHFGIKILFGDFTRGAADRNYLIERHAHTQSGGMAVPGLEGLDEAFTGWITQAFGPKGKISLVEYLKGYGLDAGELAYLSELERMACEVAFDGATLKRGDSPLDTTLGAGASAYSGLSNVWLYVCSAKTKKLYSALGQEDRIHHSTFLQGAPVLGAGDWLVADGQVLFINAESGHYRPSLENMLTFASSFSGHWPQKTMIQPEHKGEVYRIHDFIRLGTKAPAAPQDIVDRITGTVGKSFAAKAGADSRAWAGHLG